MTAGPERTAARTSPAALAEWDGHEVADLRERWNVAWIEAYAEIGSTNDRARTVLGERGEVAVIVADRQGEGRGRRGRRWISDRGGLWMSVGVPVGSDPASVAVLPLRVGLAVTRALAAYLPPEHLRVKWPNDIRVREKKLAGVLCEGTNAGVVVGIGVNVLQTVDSFPSALRPRVTTVAEWTTNPPSRSELAGHIVSGLTSSGLPGPAHLLPTELAGLAVLDELSGKRVRGGDEGRDGLAVGIAADGGLLVQDESGAIRPVYGGEIQVEGEDR